MKLVLPYDILIIRWPESWQSLECSYDHQMSCVVICLFPLPEIPPALPFPFCIPARLHTFLITVSYSSFATLFLLFDHHLALPSPSDTSSSPPPPHAASNDAAYEQVFTVSVTSLLISVCMHTYPVCSPGFSFLSVQTCLLYIA